MRVRLATGPRRCHLLASLSVSALLLLSACGTPPPRDAEAPAAPAAPTAPALSAAPSAPPVPAAAPQATAPVQDLTPQAPVAASVAAPASTSPAAVAPRTPPPQASAQASTGPKLPPPRPQIGQPPKPSQAQDPRAYRRDAARHLYGAYGEHIYKGRMPPLLYAIGVLQVDIGTAGEVEDIRWMRAPSHAPEVVSHIEAMVRAAAPYPVPSRMGRVTYTDVWLWDKSSRFQLDTLTEGQR